jgi:hypothetical protein
MVEDSLRLRHNRNSVVANTQFAGVIVGSRDRLRGLDSVTKGAMTTTAVLYRVMLNLYLFNNLDLSSRELRFRANKDVT